MRLDESKKETAQASAFTRLAVRRPFVILLLGITGALLVGVAAPQSESDWLGASFFVPVGIAVLIASGVAVGCAITAFVRHERLAYVAAIIAVPAFLIILWFVKDLILASLT